MPSGAKCNLGVCDCADGESYVRGRCRPLKGLKEYCNSDLDCYFGYDRHSVQCLDNVCACADGYYNRHGNICRRKSMDIGDVCVVGTDCEHLGANAKCVNLKCQLVDEIKSTDKIRDIKNNNHNNNSINSNNNNNHNNNNYANNNSINDYASASASVSRTKRQTSIAASETPSNRSRSSPSESTLDNQPTKLVNGERSRSSSNNNNDNSNTISSDSDSVGTIPERLTKPQTQPQSQLQAQKSISNSVTGPSSQSQKTESIQNQHRVREIAVQTSLEAFELKPLAIKKKHVGTVTTASTSSSSRRPSKQRRRPTLFRFDDDEKTFSTVSNTDDDNETKLYGSSCTESGKPCANLPHSICSNSICLCKQGYYNKNGKCFAELGEIAESSDECENEYEPVSKKCICQNNYFYERNLRECRKPIQYHLSCTSNSQCSPFGAAYCLPDVPRRCTCEEYAEYDALLEMCVLKQGLGSECDATDQCPVANSVCSNRHCVCKENYAQKGNECVLGIGAECSDDRECSNIENSKCDDTTSSNAEESRKSCQCRKGFVHFKDECIKEAEEIEEECEDTAQCKPLLATCTNNKCTCAEGQHFQDGQCATRKGLGEPCSKASECFLEKDAENVECRNSVCQCKFGYQQDTEQKICYRVAPSKKNSSGRPSALKVITFLLIGSAFLITSAAIKQAYY